MRTFSRVIFSLLLLLPVSCAVVLRYPSGTVISASLKISVVGTLTTYTCTPISISAVTASGDSRIATSNTAIALSGLGSGTAYSTLSHCQTGTNGVNTVFLSTGNSSVTFYYRTNVEESLNLSASTYSMDTATQKVDTVLFQVLGQTNANQIQNIVKGENAPATIITVGTRLFIADRNNNRVIVFNTIPTSSYDTPGYVLGQTNLSTNICNFGGVSAQSLCSPAGIFSDGTRLFVADSSNNRVLVWNSIPTTSGQAASFALGQPNLISSTSNNGGISASSLSVPRNGFSDGTKLFVADTANHRVLIWNTMPTTSGQAADVVLGQPNFGVGQINSGGAASGTTMYFPYAAFSDGTHLFVADNSNKRVLVWNSIPTTNTTSADFVLGQANLSATSWGMPNAQWIESPAAIYSDGTKLYISDYAHSRILAWNSMPTVSNQAADFVIGQPNMTNNTITSGAAGTYSPTGVFSDGTRLYVGDTMHNRTLIWNSLPTTDGAAADIVLGQPDFNNTASNYVVLNAASLNTPNFIHSDGIRLFVADSLNHRVLIWNNIPTSNGQAADVVLGQPDLVSNTSNNGGVSGSSLNNPNSVFSDGTRLFVSDSGNNRVLVWNAIPTVNAQSADFAIGQGSLTTNGNGTTGTDLTFPRSAITVGTRLFVADFNNNRVQVWNTIPSSNGQSADFSLGQVGLTAMGANVGGLSASSLARPAALYSDGTRLFVVDYLNNRVLGWNTIPTGFAQAADFVLGQSAMNTNTSGVSATKMFRPSGVSGDGTRLIVSDLTNNRLLIWNSMPSSNGQAADSVLGQPDFVSNSANNGGLSVSSVNSPRGPYCDGTRIFIADGLNNRVTIVPMPGI